jgi:large subunit ribosomal protein L29
MAIEKLSDFSSYADIELQGELEKLATTYQQLRFEHAIKGLQDPRDIRTVRRNIARVNTELRKREIAAGINISAVSKKQQRRRQN